MTPTPTTCIKGKIVAINMITHLFRLLNSFHHRFLVQGIPWSDGPFVILVLWMDCLECQRHNYSYGMVSNTKIWVEISIVLTTLYFSLTSPLFWIRKLLFPLNNIPDGCITCFCAFVTVVPIWPNDPNLIIDLAFIDNGAHSVHVPNEHYTFVNNFLLRDLCQNTDDGWHIKCSRVPGHTDHVVIRLDDKGHILQG
ncbi:hypothetical protein K492DRAFT_180108 [Lichtheimia hyalospora FSU 10163]|nr:hypothetical protein K492DRAFT_180108 [Lichtheimia hyalospora FSU 10163]